MERSDAEQAAPAGRAAMVGQLLSLYTGHFLASEDASWVIGARERLRSKFLRSVSTIGLMLERAGAWHELSSLYRRALELAPLVEEFHRGLMVSYKAQGSVAEALDAYRRCRELLTAVGVEPSALTLAVYRSLKGDAA